MKRQGLILGIIALVIIGIGVSLAISSKPDSKQPGQTVDSQSLIRSSSQMTGKPDAKVQLIEFGDFQCPACAYAEPILEKVIEEYKDKNFNFVFRNFPLSQHKNAMIAAESAESAAKQGKYWEYHNKLYASQQEWSEAQNARDFFEQYAKDLGLNMDEFNTDLDKHNLKLLIDQDIQDGTAIGVNSTPTLYLNGQKLDKIYTFEEFKSAIDSILNDTASTSVNDNASSTPSDDDQVNPFQ